MFSGNIILRLWRSAIVNMLEPEGGGAKKPQGPFTEFLKYVNMDQYLSKNMKWAFESLEPRKRELYNFETWNM